MTLRGVFTTVAPEAIVLVGACLVLLAAVTRRLRGTAWTPGAALAFVVAALLATLLVGTPDERAVPGLWVTPLTFYVRCIGLSIGALVLLVNWRQPHPAEQGEYFSLILFSLLGVLLTASANDFIVLLFAVELVSVPTYVLIALSRDDGRAPEAAVKYFFLGALATALLAYGVALLYGAAGTTTMHVIFGSQALAVLYPLSEMGSLPVIGLLLAFAGLAFKVTAVPFHVYAPDVYEGAAAPVSGLLGFFPKLAGFVALVKVFAAANWDLPSAVMWAVWIIAALTMIAGNVLALLQQNVKRLLAYSSIAHTGYMLIALLVGPAAGIGPMQDGVAALLFYITVYGAMNLGAFAVLSMYTSEEGELETFTALGGLAARAPATAAGLAICTLSLMGLPPTAGFLAKVYVFGSAFSLGPTHPFQQPLIVLAVIGVLTSAIGAAYYLRLVAAAYMAEEAERPVPAGGLPIRLGVALCSLAMIVVFAWPSRLVSRAQSATVVLQQSIYRDSARATGSDTQLAQPSIRSASASVPHAETTGETESSSQAAASP